jgi:uncharacterized membrane protein
MNDHRPQSSSPSPSPVSIPVIERNIEALLARRRAEDQALGWQDKVAAAITNFSGSMFFVYIHVVLFGLWILSNVGLIPGAPRFDPTLVVLAMFASVEAIFLSTFILITQKRMISQADRRAELTLQISLLAEHEITRLLAISKEIARHIGIPEAVHPDVEVLSRDIPPEKVLEQMDHQEHQFSKEQS